MDFFMPGRRLFLALLITAMWFAISIFLLRGGPLDSVELMGLTVMAFILTYTALRLSNLLSQDEHKQLRQRKIAEKLESLDYDERDIELLLKRKRLEEDPYFDGEIPLSEFVENYDERQKR